MSAPWMNKAETRFGPRSLFSTAVSAIVCSPPIKRAELLAPVAVRRIDDRRRSVEHMVAAEQQPVFLQKEAQMIGRMPGRCNDPDRLARQM